MEDGRKKDQESLNQVLDQTLQRFEERVSAAEPEGAEPAPPWKAPEPPESLEAVARAMGAPVEEKRVGGVQHAPPLQLVTRQTRNRAERRRIAHDVGVYRLVPLFKDKQLLDGQEVLGLAPKEGEEHYLEGEIDGCLYLSVPETTSYAAAQRLRQQVLALHPGKTVMVTSHNVEFLTVQRLPAKQAAKVLDEVERQRTRAPQPVPEVADE